MRGPANQKLGDNIANDSWKLDSAKSKLNESSRSNSLLDHRRVFYGFRAVGHIGRSGLKNAYQPLHSAHRFTPFRFGLFSKFGEINGDSFQVSKNAYVMDIVKDNFLWGRSLALGAGSDSFLVSTTGCSIGFTIFFSGFGLWNNCLNIKWKPWTSPTFASWIMMNK